MIVSHFSGIQSLSLQIFKYILVCLFVCFVSNKRRKGCMEGAQNFTTHVRFMAGGNYYSIN